MLSTVERSNYRRTDGRRNDLRQRKGPRERAIVEQLLAEVDIKVNGGRPWDIQVDHEDFFRRVLAGGSLALGESYMDGWWNCKQLDDFIYRVLRSDLKNKVKSWKDRLGVVQAKLMNKQSLSRAFQVGKQHYDKGNDLFEAMLDERMIYSCGYWKTASSLEEAQAAKLELVCKKLDIRPGMRVLDIGCGWGGTARYIAENYKAEVTGVTVSEEQVGLASRNTEGLPVDIRLQDYRKLEGSFDRILSIGMFEHVGYKNYRTFMQTARCLLKKTGLFLLHTIGGNLSSTNIDPWIERYIFPNANLPSINQTSAAFEGIFVMEDWHNFGPDYDKTLMEWFRRFDSHWPSLKKKYDRRFYRMWKYYLLSCAGAFRARHTQLWQIVLSPSGIYRSYQCPR
jgi:cyclopropane-fatty-acyl-phospholipid synthase